MRRAITGTGCRAFAARRPRPPSRYSMSLRAHFLWPLCKLNHAPRAELPALLCVIVQALPNDQHGLAISYPLGLGNEMFAARETSPSIRFHRNRNSSRLYHTCTRGIHGVLPRCRIVTCTARHTALPHPTAHRRCRSAPRSFCWADEIGRRATCVCVADAGCAHAGAAATESPVLAH